MNGNMKMIRAQNEMSKQKQSKKKKNRTKPKHKICKQPLAKQNQKSTKLQIANQISIASFTLL